jgi:hypothetical protein
MEYVKTVSRGVGTVTGKATNLLVSGAEKIHLKENAKKAAGKVSTASGKAYSTVTGRDSKHDSTVAKVAVGVGGAIAVTSVATTVLTVGAVAGGAAAATSVAMKKKSGEEDEEKKPENKHLKTVKSGAMSMWSGLKAVGSEMGSGFSEARKSHGGSGDGEVEQEKLTQQAAADYDSDDEQGNGSGGGGGYEPQVVEVSDNPFDQPNSADSNNSLIGPPL